MDDARPQRDLLPGQPVRVARPVPAIVVVADGRDGVAEEAEAVDDPRALLGVALHQRPLLARELGRLQEQSLRGRIERLVFRHDGR